MSMYTAMENTKTNEVIIFRTQQYECGTYVIENDNPRRQYGLNVKEQQFHKDLRSGKVLKGTWRRIKRSKLL